MAMTNFVSTLCLVLLCNAIFLGSSTLAAAQESGLGWNLHPRRNRQRQYE